VLCEPAGEAAASLAMQQGAADYLLKGQLLRLVPALLRAVDAGENGRARTRTDQELEVSKKRLSELAQHLQTSVEMERAAIAREIHDDVGGALTAVKFDLAWLARNAAGAAGTERAQQALEAVNHAIEASQRIMHNLRPAILEQGLVAALQWMTKRFERRTGVATEFRTSHEQIQLPPGVSLVAYRTAQEGLTNISKHAQATRVQVDLAVAAGVLSLEISDNGRGLSNEDLAKARSFGIRGLHERAGTVGGWIDMTSAPGGTTLILSVPLAGTAREPAPVVVDAGEHDPSTWGAL
jgi:signal transduction histidine kinase